MIGVNSMREVRMEITSYEEAIEYCKMNNLSFIKCYEGKGSNSGKLMMLALDYRDYSKRIEEEDELRYLEYINSLNETNDTIIFTYINNKRFYISNGTGKSKEGTTFYEGDAKRFPYTKALIKARSMTKRGKYNWEVLRIQ